MRKPGKLPTRASIKRNLKRFEQRLAFLDKQFDLGFITEKQFESKWRNSVKQSVEFSLGESELVLKHLNSAIRRKKLHLTRTKQDFMLLLTSSYATKEVTEKWEIAINDIEKDLNDWLKNREKVREQIKKLSALLITIKNLSCPEEE